jgi:hypothetical protein
VYILDIEGSQILKVLRLSGWMGSIKMKCSEGWPTRSDSCGRKMSGWDAELGMSSIAYYAFLVIIDLLTIGCLLLYDLNNAAPTALGQALHSD